jgi:hypothetical protein
MSETYTPVYTDATRDAYAGKSGQDPRAYTTDVARRVDFKYTLNPLYNETLNLIRGSVADGTYRKTWTCLAGLNVGDPVYVSATDTVSLALATTAATSRVVGFVRYKPTTTSCYLDHFILKTGLSGLTAGNPVYLSDAGGFAATAGTISKVLGIATDTDEAIVEADQGGAEVGALSGTTANTFTIDSDSATGKIIIDVALGAADKTLTLTNAVLTDNRTITFPDATGTVALTGDTPTAHAASHITGGGDTIASAVAGGAAGLMTGADKTRLDGIESGADVTDAANVLAALAEPAADIVINEDGHDHDFRIESDTLTHAFFVQGSDGFVGIGCTPKGLLQLKDYGAIDGNANELYITNNTYYDGGWKHIKSGYASFFEMRNHTGDIVISTGDTGAADSAVTFTERLVLQNGGYFGIGMTPASPINVKAVGTGGSSGFTLTASDDSNGCAALYQSAAGSGALSLTKNDVGVSVLLQADGVSYFNGGNVGLGEIVPGTLFDMAGTAPYLTIHNTTHEDGAGGREGKIIFEGEQSGEELTTLGEIEFSHDGASDDEKGKLVIRLNDGNDGTSPTERLSVISDGTATLTGNFYPGADNTYYLGKNDDDSPLAWKAVILKDTTNGKYYRVEVISGVVTATDLTD